MKSQKSLLNPTPLQSMNKEEIVLETIEYYSKNPRSVNYSDNTSRCVYLSDSGAMCALGRCMTEDALKKVHEYEMCGENNSSVYDIARHFECNVDDLLKPEYHGYSEMFWAHLQNLHDRARYWTENGLNEDGKGYVDIMFGIKLP